MRSVAGKERVLRPGAPAHECGVFGISSPDPKLQAAPLALMGLYALQHRGQESAGIAVRDGETIQVLQGMGLVSEALPQRRLDGLTGSAAIGHVRYSTAGASTLNHAQPLFGSRHGRSIALAHNGNLLNAASLRRELEREGLRFVTDVDSEVILQLFLHAPGPDPVDVLRGISRRVVGGYAVLLLTQDALIGMRDPNGIRPLILGRLGDAALLASESCALEAVGARIEEEVGPGEGMVIRGGEVSRFSLGHDARPAFCVFEFVYFARPDSEFGGKNVHLVRREIGRQLARESPVPADVVLPSPDSGTAAALGYAEVAGIPFELGVVKNRYVGRSFIQPTPELREQTVTLKLNPIRQVVAGRRVVLVDDSIVRGTTSARLVRRLREGGAREVHVRVASPPYLNPCLYGIDTPPGDKLIAASHTVEEIRRAIGADSLAFLSEEGLFRAVGISKDRLCTACFTGEYPTPLEVTPSV